MWHFHLVYAVRGQHFPTIRVDSQSKSNTLNFVRKRSMHAVYQHSHKSQLPDS